MYLSTETFYFEFSTYSPTTGLLTNADSTPTGILVINNADQAASGSTLVTITNSATGVYKGSVGLTAANVTGSEFYVRVTAIVGGVTAKQCTATQKIERITGDGFAGLGFVGETVFATDLLPETAKTDAYLPVSGAGSDTIVIDGDSVNIT